MTSGKEDQHLDLLSLFHTIFGCLTAFGSCIFFVHVFIGLAIVSGHFVKEPKADAMPMFFGWLFVVIGATMIVLGWTLAACILVAAHKLKHRKSRIYCIVIAAIECLNMPLGTLLGVFTLVALTQENVAARFQPPPLPTTPGEGV